jgi:hypothetical protein
MSKEYLLVVDRRRRFRVKLSRSFQLGDTFNVDGVECAVWQIVPELEPPHVYLRSKCQNLPKH